ncbi:MAG TPA: hypothetical protein VGS08_04210 [Candidatus Saccharimonadales bacterium]|nr:hypothetical protein [Candidatus Saccharimonadales bacterium]
MPQKKPILNYLVVAGRTLQDSATNRWSYIDLFDTILIPEGADTATQSFVVAGRLDNVTAGPSQTQVTITAPDDELAASIELSGQLEAGSVNMNAIFELIKFEKAGRYHLHVTYNGKQLDDDSRFYFDVKKL